MSLDFGMKILIVEDFGVTRKLEIKALTKIGFQEILQAEDGRAAIRMLEKDGDVGLIISDWNMPNMNGYELLKWVRSSPKHRGTPFIMVTAQAEKKDADNMLKAGADGFITKPFTFEELKGVIETTFSVERPADREIPQKTPSGRIKLTVGHIQITDHLVLGVLKHLIDTGALAPSRFELDTRCMSGWNPVQKALDSAEVDAAFIMAPIAMDLYRSGAPIKLVLLAHKNGSICVRNKPENGGLSFKEFCRNKVFYIPHVLSVHHMLSKMLFRELGLKAGLVGHDNLDVTFEVIPPVMMPEFLSTSKDACGFLVAQPIGAKTIFDGNAELVFLSGQVWEHHPCCVVVMQQKIVDTQPDAVQEFVDFLVKAGDFIENHPDEAAKIAVNFLDPEEELRLSAPVLEGVLSEHHGVRTHDLYPFIEDLETLQRYMVDHMGIGGAIDLTAFVDTRFADLACPSPAGGRRKPSVFHNLSKIVEKL